MSRSRKKVPGYTDRNPWAKKQANKKVRRSLNVPNGKAYKKFYCSYDICDWTFLFYRESEITEYCKKINKNSSEKYQIFTK